MCQYRQKCTKNGREDDDILVNMDVNASRFRLLRNQVCECFEKEMHLKTLLDFKVTYNAFF